MVRGGHLSQGAFPQRAAAWGGLQTDRFLENCRAQTVQKYGRFFSCWNVLWATWSLARTATTWSGVFGNAGGCARVATRKVICAELALHASVGAKSRYTRSGRMCFHVTLLMIWRLTRGRGSWGTNLRTSLLRKGRCSMRSGGRCGCRSSDRPKIGRIFCAAAQ